MKKERLQQTMQKYKGLCETIMNNSMVIKWIIWKKWTDSKKINIRKETIKIRAEISEKEMKETIVKINKTKSWFFEEN